MSQLLSLLFTRFLRFDLQELQQLCERHRVEADYTREEEHCNDQTDLALMELLRSMWNEGDDDDDDNDERTEADGERDEERGLEQCQGADVTSGDREMHEEQVNEEEMEEIYEFAATQRKREEEDSVEEKVDEEKDGEVFTKLTEPKRSSRGFSEKSLQPNSSLDRSYNRLFSDSWGVYKEEENPTSLHSTSPPPETHTLQSPQHQSLHKPSSELSGRTLLQSSASVVDNLSVSPPPTSNLPIPGLSPGIVADWVGGGDAIELEECLSLKQESQGPCNICDPLSPDSPQEDKKPELIVLSDSSEELEVDVAVLSSRSPSPPSPYAIQTLHSYTHIKPQPIPKPKEPSCSDFSPSDPSSVTVPSRPGSGCDQSPVDCSPEVSWLIPSTPVQPGGTIRTSSTQTKSRMCRTQLFPKGDTSSPSSSVFSSPALPQPSNSPSRDSAHVGPADGSVSRLKQDRTVPLNSSLDLNFCPKRTSSRITSKDREVDSPVFKEPQLSHLSSSTYPYLLQASPKQDPPLPLQPQPYSSTPLHTDLHQPPVLLADSPLHTEPDERDRALSESPEKTELRSFHLSPFSDPSDPPSSSSHRGLQSSQRHSKSSSQNQRAVKSSSHNDTGSELRSGITNEEGGGERECESKGTDDKGEHEEAKGGSGEAEAADSHFQQSFMAMDEPPIAFNDSWGFDACVDLVDNPGCFSLRLEDSGASSLQEKTKSSHHVHSLNSQGGVTASSPSKATSEQAHAGPSFTPSPPDPTTLPTPDIINSLLDSKIWDSWEEEEEEDVLPLSQRMNPSAPLKTPGKQSHSKRSTSGVMSIQEFCKTSFYHRSVLFFFNPNHPDMAL